MGVAMVNTWQLSPIQRRQLFTEGCILGSMSAAPNCVFVVVDREFGARLSELEGRGAIWVVHSELNRTVAQEIWRQNPSETHLVSVTVFKSFEGCSTEDSLINELDTIDLHHGQYSADPPYTVLEVIGTPLTEKIKVKMSHFGFDHFETRDSMFRAVRPLSSIPEIE
jgi:hypothetical protein